MPWARQAAFTYLQTRLRESHGIVLEARNLDYNLLGPWFELKQVSIRFLGKTGLPPILKADRISVRLRHWDMITGAGVAEGISADGLDFQWVIDKEGRNNLPETRMSSHASGLSALPVRHLEITHATLSLTNEQTSFLVRLPPGFIHSEYRQESGEQTVWYATHQAGLIRWNGKELPLDRLTLESVLRPDGFEVVSMDLAFPNSRIQARGRLNNFDTPRLNFSASSDVDCEQLVQFGMPASGKVKISLDGVGTLGTLKLSGTVSSDRLTVAGLRSEATTARLEYDQESQVLRIKQLSTGIFSGTLRASGQIDTGKHGTDSALLVEVAHADVRQAASALGWKIPLPGTVDARLDLAWPGRRWPQLQMKAVGQVHPRRGKAGSLDSSWRFDVNTQNRNGLVRMDINSVSAPGATVRGNVDVRLDGTALEGRIQGDIGSLGRFSQALASLAGHHAGSMTAVPIEGNAELTASLSGSVRRPLVSLDVKVNSLSAGRFTDANLQLQANYSPDRLELQDALLQWRNQEATASGSIGLGSPSAPLHLEARLERVSIPEIVSLYGFHPEISGTASGKLNISGSLSSPVGNLAITMDQLQAYGEPLGQLTSELTWQNQKVVLNRLRLEKPQPTGTGIAEGRGIFDLASREYELQLDGKNLQSSTLQVPGDVGLAGRFGFKATGKGAFDNPSFQLKLDGRELEVAKYPVGDLQMHVQLANRHSTVDLEVASSAGEGRDRDPRGLSDSV